MLLKFTKYKILGPDGWPLEHFISFFDIIRKEILELVELSRREITMHGSINSAFTSLIKKKYSPYASHFRPLALCNLIYKMVTKVIIDRIKSNLSEVISKEQFVLLSNRQILDAIGVS